MKTKHSVITLLNIRRLRRWAVAFLVAAVLVPVSLAVANQLGTRKAPAEITRPVVAAKPLSRDWVWKKKTHSFDDMFRDDVR